MASWTLPADIVGAWIGEGAPADDLQVQKWIDKAEREIRFRVPTITARIAAAEPDLLDTAKDVVVAMVTRVFRNPEGIRQRNTTTGPFTESATYGGNTPGGLALSDDEFAKLQGVRSRGAFSISLIPPTSPFYVASA
jgi:hypothetical protein